MCLKEDGLCAQSLFNYSKFDSQHYPGDLYDQLQRQNIHFDDE